MNKQDLAEHSAASAVTRPFRRASRTPTVAQTTVAGRPTCHIRGGAESIVDDGFADVDQLAAHPGIEDRTPVLLAARNNKRSGAQ